MQCDKCWSYDCKNILVIGLICLKILPISYLSSRLYVACTVKTKQCSLPFSPLLSPFLSWFYKRSLFLSIWLQQAVGILLQVTNSSYPETFFWAPHMVFRVIWKEFKNIRLMFQNEKQVQISMQNTSGDAKLGFDTCYFPLVYQMCFSNK